MSSAYPQGPLYDFTAESEREKCSSGQGRLINKTTQGIKNARYEKSLRLCTENRGNQKGLQDDFTLDTLLPKNLSQKNKKAVQK